MTALLARPGAMGAGARCAPGDEGTLIVACGALARELHAVLERTPLAGRVALSCLPPLLHNTPDRIPQAVTARIRWHLGRAGRTNRAWTRVLVAYAECGTRGGLDEALESLRAELGAGCRVERLPGPHCYEVLAGEEQLASMLETEPGTFLLTDYLVRHFDRLVWATLGLNRHPELLPVYFGHYRRVAHLRQRVDSALAAKARTIAQRLGLELVTRWTGLEPLGAAVEARLVRPRP